MNSSGYAGMRLANAVEIYLRDRDPSALSGLKLTLSDYRQAEERSARSNPELPMGDLLDELERIQAGDYGLATGSRSRMHVAIERWVQKLLPTGAISEDQTPP